jgi:hypothetical protein
MSKPLKSFLVKLIYLTLIVYAGGFLVFRYLFPGEFYPFFAFLPVIFYLVNAVFHGTLLVASRQNMQKFSQRFLAVFGVKILILLAFIITYAYLNPTKAVAFLITFFVLYLIYTSFEVISVLRYLRNTRS